KRWASARKLATAHPTNYVQLTTSGVPWLVNLTHLQRAPSGGYYTAGRERRFRKSLTKPSAPAPIRPVTTVAGSGAPCGVPPVSGGPESVTTSVGGFSVQVKIGGTDSCTTGVGVTTGTGTSGNGPSHVYENAGAVTMSSTIAAAASRSVAE